SRVALDPDLDRDQTWSRSQSRPLDRPLDGGAGPGTGPRMRSEGMGSPRVNQMRIGKLRVLIIDGHLGIGRGLKALIEEIPGLQVVGLATRGERGLAQAAASAPDVALVDAELPGLCSAAVIRLLRWRLPRTRVIALGIYPERRRAALDAGAHDFVLKD